jgi:8-oxo-dGTP pyrophosphatase MutT (NUDIX family)
MIKIFYNKKILSLTNISMETNLTAKIVFSDEEDIKKVINYLLDESEKNIDVLCRGEVENYLEILKNHFIFLEAAGGIVSNIDNKVLLILKRNIWDLPKGKKDAGEEVSKTATREVSEECGLDIPDLDIVKYIDSTYHVYFEKDKYFLKQTYWFLIHYNGNNAPIGEVKEGITKVKWFSVNQLTDVVSNTYPSVQDILSKCELESLQ